MSVSGDVAASSDVVSGVSQKDETRVSQGTGESCVTDPVVVGGSSFHGVLSRRNDAAKGSSLFSCSEI